MGIFELYDGADVPGGELTGAGAVFAVDDEQLADAFGDFAVSVEEVGPAGDRAGIDTKKGEFAEVFFGHGFENLRDGFAVGTVIERQWRDRTLVLRVTDAGFELAGVVHGSLSAAAFAATGTKWNGRLFWQVSR